MSAKTVPKDSTVPRMPIQVKEQLSQLSVLGDIAQRNRLNQLYALMELMPMRQPPSLCHLMTAMFAPTESSARMDMLADPRISLLTARLPCVILATSVTMVPHQLETMRRFAQ